MYNHTNLQIYQDVISALEQDELYQALHLLKDLINADSNYDLYDDWDKIFQSYHTLLSYMSQGIPDDKRETFYHQFVRNCYSLSYRAFRASQMNNRVSLYYSYLRTAEQEKLSLDVFINKIEINRQQFFFSSVTADTAQTDKLKQDENLLMNDLFDFIWTSGEWSEHDVQIMENLFQEEDFQEDNKLLLISAISLSVSNYLDYKKVLFLIQLYRTGAIKMRVRAFIGLIFSLIFNNGMLHHFPALIKEIMKLQNDPHFINDLASLQIQLLCLSKTEDAQHKINEEIIPNFIKSRGEMSNNIVDIKKLEEMLDDENEFDSPFDKTTTNKLRDGISELMNMHEQGVDVYYATFKNMKNFSFFNTISNWFRPFNFNYYDLSNMNSPEYQPLRAIILDSDMCDSDKYSLGFMFHNLPIANLQMIKEQIGNVFGTAFVETPTSETKKDPIDNNVLRRLYLQDCYRFFMLYGDSHEFKNPFKKNLLLSDYSLFNTLLSQSQEELLKIGYFAYQQKKWLTTIHIFRNLSDTYPLPLEALQMYGFSLLKIKDFNLAIEYFKKVIILSPSSIWTYRQLALCYRSIGNVKEAIDSYQKIIELVPEDTSALLHLGECLFLEGHIDEAMKQFYKVEYLHPDLISVMRAIAWYSLCSNKPQQAEKYYQRIFSAGAKPKDYLNAGHSAWINGHTPEAIERYQKFLDMTRKDNELFSFPDSDIRLLESYGIALQDIHFMTDFLNEKHFISSETK